MTAWEHRFEQDRADQRLKAKRMRGFRADRAARSPSVCESSLLCVSSYHYMCPHATICVLMLLYMCPHTTMYVSSHHYVCVLILLYVSTYYYICVLILLYVFSYYYACVLILLYMCPHTTMCVSSYCLQIRDGSYRATWSAFVDRKEWLALNLTLIQLLRP
jgi:hypothetical protein